MNAILKNMQHQKGQLTDILKSLEVDTENLRKAQLIEAKMNRMTEDLLVIGRGLLND